MGDPQVSDGRSRLSSLMELDQLLPQAGAGGKRAIIFLCQYPIPPYQYGARLVQSRLNESPHLSNGNMEVLF
jgi:hypothetical protein